MGLTDSRKTRLNVFRAYFNYPIPDANKMSDEKPHKNSQYTCDDYRMEMRLLGMRQQLNNSELSNSDKEKLQNEIDKLEKDIGLS